MYDIEVINRIKDCLKGCNETLAIAESVTSGHLQAAVSLADMATQFYQGGTTTYNLAQKTSILAVDPVHAQSCNCVSERVATEMAIGASRLFRSDWAISITGYAAPVPELNVTELFAFWAVVHRGEVKEIEAIRGEKGEPLEVQIAYTNHVLRGLLRCLESVKQ